MPNADTDFIFFTAAAMINQYQWSQDKALQQWMVGNRLDGASSLISKISREDDEKQEVIKRLQKNAPLAAAKLFELQEGLTLSREWS